MAETFDLVLKGGTVVNHDGAGVRDVGVRAGRIAAIGTIDRGRRCARSSMPEGCTSCPGVIDTQVHFREPGLEHKEDLETGSRAAVLGGVTAVFEMPNTKPLTTSAATLADKVARARKAACSATSPSTSAATRENVGDIPDAGAARGLGRHQGVHGLLDRRSAGRRRGDARSHARRASAARLHFTPRTRRVSRSAWGCGAQAIPPRTPSGAMRKAALIATTRLVRLAEKHKKRVHVLHVSTAEEMAFLADHKQWASVEVTPHHLTLVAPDCYRELGAYAQMNPPVRDERHRRAMWAALADGVVDVLGSDHAPHTRAEKEAAYPASHSGMTGVQTLVPIMLDHVNAGRLSLQRFVDLTSAGPQRLFGIRNKGRIAVGLRRRPDGRRPEAARDDHQRLDREPLRLDAL